MRRILFLFVVAIVALASVSWFLTGGRAAAYRRLQIAASKGDTQGVELWLRLGLDPNALLASPPLALAVSQQHVETVRFLLAKGANPNVGSKGDGRLLESAIRTRNVELVRLLIEAGASVAPHGRSLAEFAAQRCDVSIVELLVAAGAEPLVPSGYCVEMAPYTRKDDEPAFRLDLTPPDAGWIDLTLTCGGAKYSLPISYVPRDSLLELASAVLTFLETGRGGAAQLYSEPEEHDLRFSAGDVPSLLRVELLHFTGGRKKAAAPTLVQACEGDARLIGRSIWRSFRRLQSEFDEGQWRYPFPTKEVEALGRITEAR